VPAVGQTIHFCSPSFKQSPVDLCELAETIVHESAHLAISAGAFLIHEPYYQQGKWKEIYSTDKLIKTADSYSSFSAALYKQKYPGYCPKTR
jgi:hypothetical protein